MGPGLASRLRHCHSDELSTPTEESALERIDRHLHGLKRGVERVEKTMTRESITAYETRSQDFITAGKKREMKRFLGKQSQQLSYLSVAAKEKRLRYPAQLTTTWMGIMALATFLGSGLSAILQSEQQNWGTDW